VVAKTYYEMLHVSPGASTDDVKRAFRQQISRYHPDKVQHLGEEFQELAEERAAALTEAYRVLSDPLLRDEYDRSRAEGQSPAPSVANASSTATAPAPKKEPLPRSARKDAGLEDAEDFKPFSFERAAGDEVVMKAAIARFRKALTGTVGSFDESSVPGFDLAWVPKAKLFSRAKPTTLLVRFVSRVDKSSVCAAWTSAARGYALQQDTCLFLMGPSIAEVGELAGAIDERRRVTARSVRLTLISVNTRDWSALVPVDAPPVAKSLLGQLRAGA